MVAADAFSHHVAVFLYQRTFYALSQFQAAGVDVLFNNNAQTEKRYGVICAQQELLAIAARLFHTGHVEVHGVVAFPSVVVYVLVVVVYHTLIAGCHQQACNRE